MGGNPARAGGLGGILCTLASCGRLLGATEATLALPLPPTLNVQMPSLSGALQRTRGGGLA